MNRLVTLTSILVLSCSTHAQNTKGIKIGNLKGADTSLMTNHDPAVEKANFNLLPGYEVNLFASEPMLANPVHMVWDSRGRLWVACSWAYPQLKPGEVANDKIIILEDTNSDGKADKSTVFAEGLYMPTGIERSNGGCYVAQTPDVFFFKDTDGDDIADVKELALTGFGIEDSHHSISAWRRGPGGWLYFQEGIFLHTQVETQHGVVRNYNGGIYQFNPRTGELRVFANLGMGNPWGHVFDRWGQSFLVDNPRVSYISPGTGNSGNKLRLQPLMSTEKQCGGDLASGTHLPEDIRGQLLTCRFKSRAIVRYEFIEDGAGFSANVHAPLMSSRHPNFRPVDCKIGPDGAIYVADWYNSIINHAQHDFRDARRDHDHGRVWRVTAKGRPLMEKPKLVGASIPDLLDHLKSPAAWTRHQARLELSERDHDKVEKELHAWVERLSPKDPDHDHHLVEAMWTLQNVERPSEAILKRVMSAKDGHARAAGARVMRYWHEQISDPVALIAKGAGDSFPRARMETILSAGFIPKAEAFTAALNALDHGNDKFISIALPQTVTALEPYWRPALDAGKLKFARSEHREFIERKSTGGLDKYLSAFLKKEAPGRDEIADTKSLLILEGNTKHMRMLVSALTKRSTMAPRVKVALLDVLEQVGRRNTVPLGKKILSLRKFLSDKNDRVAAGTARALGAWKAKDAGRPLVSILRDGRRAVEVRRAAAIALGGLGRPEYVRVLKQLASNGDTESRYIATGGLAVANLEEAAGHAALLLQKDPGKANPTALVTIFLQRNRGANYLQKALAGVSLHPAVVRHVADSHRQTGLLSPPLARLFQDGPASLSAALLKEDRKSLVADVEKHGDPKRGEMIYRRRTLACTTCHAIGPAGPAIGPNLVAVGGAAPTSYMVESILEPNKSIAEHYENMMIATRDGMMRMGVISFKSETEVVFRDAAQAGKEVRIPAKSIAKMRPLPSLMPESLADQLQNRQEFLDLARFVSLLGRPGPYANDESPVIRKWRIVSGIGAPRQDMESPPSEDAPWLPAFSMVNGELPAGDLDMGNLVYARGFVNVQVPGKVKLKLNDARGLKLWLDGKEVSDLAAPIELVKSRRIITFGIDRTKRGKAGLRVELEAAAKSQVKFKPEGGM